MSPTFNRIWTTLAVIIALAFPVVLLVGLLVHDSIASGKRVTMDRARLSLSFALNDNGNGVTGGFVGTPLFGDVGPVGKQYGAFEVFPCSNTVIIEGSNYQCALVTAPWYQFDGEGTLAVTTNKVFIWLDYRRGAKIIAENYKVPGWRMGY